MQVSQFVAAIAAPYVICGFLAAIWRLGYLRGRRPAVIAGIVLYGLITLAPVGIRQWTIDEVVAYTLGFVIVGTPTWAGICLGYLAWLAWDGRIGRSLTTWYTVYPPGGWDRKALPLMLAVPAAISGVLPWAWPAFMLPGGLWWDVALFAVPAVLFLLFAAVNISDRPPPILIPKDLRPEAPPAEALPFWVDAMVVIVMLIPGGALTLWLQLTQGLPKGVAVLAGGALGVLVAMALYRAAERVRDRGRPPG